MESIFDFEILINLFFQEHFSFLDSVFHFFTFLGNELFFFLVIPLFYWCIDQTIGIRLGIILIASNLTNSVAKILFHFPRPYWISTKVKAITGETSFGLPSGHSQNSFSMWGIFAWSKKQRWVTLVSALVIFMIGMSRIYLGVHFLHDVLLGWVFGFVVITLFVLLEKRVKTWFLRLAIESKLTVSLIWAMAIMLVILLSAFVSLSWQLPGQWVTNAYAAYPDEPINPFSIESAFTLSGIFFGFMAGFSWNYHQFGIISVEGTRQEKVYRYLLGIAGVVLLWSGLKMLFPDDNNIICYTLRFIRYALVGYWIAGLAPAIFVKLKLAKVVEHPVQ